MLGKSFSAYLGFPLTFNFTHFTGHSLWSARARMVGRLPPAFSTLNNSQLITVFFNSSTPKVTILSQAFEAYRDYNEPADSKTYDSSNHTNPIVSKDIQLLIRKKILFSKFVILKYNKTQHNAIPGKARQPFRNYFLHWPPCTVRSPPQQLFNRISMFQKKFRTI